MNQDTLICWTNTVSLTLDSGPSRTSASTQLAHTGSSDHEASPESSCMATDRSVTTTSCLFIGSLCFCPHPPPPRKAPVILLKCASEHQSSTPRFSISLRLPILSAAFARDLLPLVHLANVYSSFHVFFHVPLSKLLCLVLRVHRHVLTQPTHITCLLSTGILRPGHRASCCLGEEAEHAQRAGKKASRGANGQPSKRTK